MPFYYNVSSLNNQVTAAPENNAAVDSLGLPVLDKSIFNAGVASAQATDSTEATEYKILPNVGTTTATTTEDGADDGKISTTEKLKSIGSGLLSPLKAIKDHPIAAAATMVAGAALVAAAPVAAPLLVAAGAAYGGYKIAKGAYKAATAETDAEAKEAYEGIGSGTADVALAAVGAKPALNAAKSAGLSVDTANMSKGRAALEILKGSAKETYKTFKTEGKVSENLGTSKKYVSGKLSNLRNSASKKYSDIKSKFSKDTNINVKPKTQNEIIRREVAKSYDTADNNASPITRAQTKLENSQAKNTKVLFDSLDEAANPGSTAKPVKNTEAQNAGDLFKHLDNVAEDAARSNNRYGSKYGARAETPTEFGRKTYGHKPTTTESTPPTTETKATTSQNRVEYGDYTYG